MNKVVWFLLNCSVLLVFPVSGECPSADLTADCYVDLTDLAVVSKWWFSACDVYNNWCEGADLFQCGSVEADDLAELISLWLTGGFCPEDMVRIPHGAFEMGDNFGERFDDELPVHTITLSSFCLSRYEITNGQYCEFLNSALSTGTIMFSGAAVYKTGLENTYRYCNTYVANPGSQIDYTGHVFSVRMKKGRSMFNDPMVQVTWYGAVAYCNWRSEQEGRQSCYNLSTWECDFSKNGYHLPTEAQWEYAARGGLSGKRFPWGNTIAHSQANYYSTDEYSYDISPTRGYHPTWNDGIYPYTCLVGSFPANGYGLYDMIGNVWEWCNDWWQYNYYSSSPQADPTGPTTGMWRVLRGGSWVDDGSLCRVTCRNAQWPDSWYLVDSGFRISLGF